MSAAVAPREAKYDVGERFRQLAAQWKEQSRHMSNVAQMAMLMPYQQIIVAEQKPPCRSSCRNFSATRTSGFGR